MQAFAKTDIGCVRKVNQDVCYVSTDPVGPFPNLFIVADGMGGHKAGDYAARFAISTFLEFASGTEDRNLIHVVNEGIREANQRVLDKAQEDPERFGGMGTTLVAAFIEGRQLYVANVGDSRLYLVSQEEINQVTEDHSYVAAMVRAHEITPEEARNHPRKNVITRAVGASGAFHVSKPSDLLPELQGRLPIRVELDSLKKEDFYRILTEPENNLILQYKALLKTENLP